jgi:hypothetical protein
MQRQRSQAPVAVLRAAVRCNPRRRQLEAVSLSLGFSVNHPTRQLLQALLQRQ